MLIMDSVMYCDWVGVNPEIRANPGLSISLLDWKYMCFCLSMYSCPSILVSIRYPYTPLHMHPDLD